ncbi:MAG: PAS domain S-box protein [Hyphomicrobiaceae bacterium]
MAADPQGEELERLRRQLAEAADALRAIRTGEIDAIVAQGPTGPAVYSLKSADTPYRLLVEQMHEGALTVSAAGVIMYANAAFASLVGVSVARLRGRDLAEFIADPSDCDPARLFGPGRDIRLICGSGRETRNVYVSSAPLSIDNSKMHCVIVTDLTRQELRRRHEAIVNSSADAIYSLTPDGIITTWNKAAERLYGYAPDEIIGRKVHVLFPSRGSEPDQSLERVLQAKQSQLETLQIDRCGRPIEVAIGIASFEAAGVPQGISVIARDVTERNRARDHIRLLLNESTHRTKNLLAVVQAIASQTARFADTFDQFQDRFADRLHSMALSHDLLVSEGWKRARLSDLVRVQLETFDPGGRVTLQGPDFYLAADAAQHVGLALHELATNAAKYGALSTAEGAIAVDWEIVSDGPEVLRLSWQERNGPPVTRPSRVGFGSTLIEKAIEHALDAKVVTEYAPQGFSWTIEIPSQYIAAAPRSPGDNQ